MIAGIICLVLGIVLFYVSVTGISYNKVLSYIVGAIFLISGILILKIAIFNPEESYMPIFFFSTGILFLIGEYYMFKEKLGCTKKVEAKYEGETVIKSRRAYTFNTYKPILSYKQGQKKHMCYCQEEYTKLRLILKYKCGRKCYIYINPENRKDYVSTRGLSSSDTICIIFGVIFIWASFRY